MNDAMSEDTPTFLDMDGNELYLANYLKPNKLMVWDKEKLRDGGYEMNGRLIDIFSVGVDELEKLSIWKDIPQEIKEEMKSVKVIEKVQVHGLTDKAKRGKRQKYPGIPKTLTCCECSEVIIVQPSIIMQRAEKRGILVDVYIKSFKCQSCCPTKGRGRIANPEFTNLPKTLTCKCGQSVSTNPYQLKAKADKMGVTIEKLIKGYQCQKCNPTKGRHKKNE